MQSVFAVKLIAYRAYPVSLIFTSFRGKHVRPKHILKMNEAFLRYEKGSEVFDISFRYVDETMNVDRQFNFSRQIAESVNSFLKRVDTNVCKIINRKVERKRKKNAALDTSALPNDNVDTGKIMLLKDDIKVDGNVLCENLLQGSAKLKLVIFEKMFLVKQNAPYIINMLLPSSILVGFPTYPSKFESLYTDKKQSIFNWYKNDAINNKSNVWTHVGSGFLYEPNVSDIGCNLKISCEPRNESDSGCNMEVESKNVVEAGPGPCPFDIRHQFTKHKLLGRSFRIMSYNILADTYADSDFSKDVLYPYCPQYALDMDYRKQLILKEIIGFNSDIICLQEVDRSVYEHDLLPSLYMLNYDGVFVTKNEINEGLATFFNQERFEKLRFEYCVMAKNIDFPRFATIWSKINNNKTKERFCSRNTTIQVTTLRSKENQSEILIIGNTHLYFKPDADHIRLLQGYYTITYVHEIAKKIQEENPECNVSVLLCGDFNSVPECGIYQLMTENYVPETCEDWRSNTEEAIENVSLTQARWPVTVNCWFCNQNSKIWREDLNWWLCSWCEQYNGFSKNGDYTYNIPEQYATPNISTRYCRLIKQSNSRNISMNHLCADCNKQENLKLLELSNFEPKSERHYNAELTKFKEYLEKRYPLCNNCKLTVQTVLNKQALWLTCYKMLFFRQKPIKMLIGNTRKLEVLSRVMSTILIPIIVYNHDFIWLPIGGLFFHLCACWANSRKKRLDILLIFLWFCIISFVYIKNSTFQNVWLMIDMVHCMIQVCAFITGFLSIKLISHKNALIGSVAFKKLKLRNVAPQSTLQNHSESKNNTSNEIINGVESSVYVTGEVSSTEIKSHSAILRQKLSTVADNNNDNHLNSQNNNSLLDGCCLNHSLSTLFLSEDSSRYGKNHPAKATPAIFERKIYSTTSSETLFKKFGSGNRRYILSPPKLRSVTQTSWVAGGYWQEGHMMTATPPTLSRSSSQSSGFGSAGSSNFAPSREPSVHEFDRCSIVSDATRWSYHASRANQSPRIEDQENYVREASVGSPKDLTPAFPDHRTRTTTTTTTIVAGSGWLSALLCGSLILNMIVLCATLLR